MLGLWVLELFAMYAMDGQTDRWMDKSNAYCPLPTGGSMITRRRSNMTKCASLRCGKQTADMSVMNLGQSDTVDCI